MITRRRLLASIPLFIGFSSARAMAQRLPGAPPSNYRLITVDPSASPFLGPPDAAYGGAKHTSWMWHAIMKRVYTYGGDFGGPGAGSFGQPNPGAPFTTNAPTSPRTYTANDGLRNDQYSIDPYAPGPVSWRLEHPYLPRNLSGSRELRPPRGCQIDMVWDSRRRKLWAIQTFLRSEFYYYLADGTPDPWANGDTTDHGDPRYMEPIGTWSFLPAAMGGVGAWTLETSATVVVRLGSPTSYTGNTLITGDADERIVGWDYDATTDRMFGFGRASLFIFNPSTKSYEYRTFAPSAYGNYFSPGGGHIAVVGNWLYALAIGTTPSGTRRSLLVRFNVSNLLALPNGGTVPDTPANFQAFVLPWSLSPNNEWETAGGLASGWPPQQNGLVTVSGKLVVIGSYFGIIENGVTKLTIFDPATETFTAGDPAPENIAGNSWVALPDTGEVMFGLNTNLYSNLRLWAYKIGRPSTLPNPPVNLRVQ